MFIIFKHQATSVQLAPSLLTAKQGGGNPTYFSVVAIAWCILIIWY